MGISSIGSRDVEAALFLDTEDYLKDISAKGDPLETLFEAVDFGRFRADLGEGRRPFPLPEWRLPGAGWDLEVQDAGAAEHSRAMSKYSIMILVRRAKLTPMCRLNYVRIRISRQPDRLAAVGAENIVSVLCGLSAFGSRRCNRNT